MMKNLVNKIIFRLFNKLFHTAVHQGNLEEIRLISNSGLNIEKKDIPVIEALTPLNITINDLQPFLTFFVKCQKKGLIFERYSDQGLISEANQFFFNLFDLIESNISEGFGNLLSNHQYFFSQEGEDIVLLRFFENKTDGFYVDIGAHHPTRFSNTYLFYKLGWRGINIEPTREINECFLRIRPEDINLPIAISNFQGKSDFYVFEEPAFNTFSESLSREYQSLGFKLTDIRKIETRKLKDILGSRLNIDQKIDFMSIDVEDHELEVLESNDWNTYRPNILLVEILNFDLLDPMASPVHKFLSGHGYKICAKTHNTVFYRDAGPRE
jgi:FkbM family methyltransferase